MVVELVRYFLFIGDPYHENLRGLKVSKMLL